MRAVRLVAAAVMALLSLNLTQAHAAPPVAPDCQFSDAYISQPVLVVDVEEIVTVDVSATATGCETYDGGTLDFIGSFLGYMHPSDEDATRWVTTLDIDPYYLPNDVAGEVLPGTVYFDGGETRNLGASLTIKRHVWVLNHYAPTKVKKHKSFFVAAIFDVADWEFGFDVGLERKKVLLQSRTSGGNWKTLKTVTSRTGQQGGVVEAKVKLKSSHCFRWVYKGSSALEAVTSSKDCTKVK